MLGHHDQPIARSGRQQIGDRVDQQPMQLAQTGRDRSAVLARHAGGRSAGRACAQKDPQQGNLVAQGLGIGQLHLAKLHRARGLHHPNVHRLIGQLALAVHIPHFPLDRVGHQRGRLLPGDPPNAGQVDRFDFVGSRAIARGRAVATRPAAILRQQLQQGLGPTPLINLQGPLRLVRRQQHRLQGAVGRFLGFKNRQPGRIAGEVIPQRFPGGDRLLQVLDRPIEPLQLIFRVAQIREGASFRVAIAQLAGQAQGLGLRGRRRRVVVLGIVRQPQVIQNAGHGQAIVRLFGQGQGLPLRRHGRRIVRVLIMQQPQLGEGARLASRVFLLTSDRQGLFLIGFGLGKVFFVGRN